MTDTLPRAGYDRASGEPVYRIREERDRRALEHALSDDRVVAAYALGHLEDGLFAHSRFWVGEGPAGHAVVMHAEAMGRATVVVGEPGAAEAILGLHPGPRAAYLSTATPAHLDALKRAYFVADVLEMQRMHVTRASFRPIEGEVERLRGRDVHLVNALYAGEGGPSRYSEDSIARAIYFGTFDGPRLVAVAGTHVVAPNVSIAVVGNVLTDRAYRGLGLAKRVTSAVTAALFERGVGEVALTVDPANTPAVRAYTTLGYEPGEPVIEARLRRRDVGVGPWLRRSAARRLGRDHGPDVEAVRGRG